MAIAIAICMTNDKLRKLDEIALQNVAGGAAWGERVKQGIRNIVDRMSGGSKPHGFWGGYGSNK